MAEAKLFNSVLSYFKQLKEKRLILLNDFSKEFIIEYETN